MDPIKLFSGHFFLLMKLFSDYKFISKSKTLPIVQFILHV